MRHTVDPHHAHLSATRRPSEGSPSRRKGSAGATSPDYRPPRVREVQLLARLLAGLTLKWKDVMTQMDEGSGGGITPHRACSPLVEAKPSYIDRQLIFRPSAILPVQRRDSSPPRRSRSTSHSARPSNSRAGTTARVSETRWKDLVPFTGWVSHVLSHASQPSSPSSSIFHPSILQDMAHSAEVILRGMDAMRSYATHTEEELAKVHLQQQRSRSSPTGARHVAHKSAPTSKLRHSTQEKWVGESCYRSTAVPSEGVVEQVRVIYPAKPAELRTKIYLPRADDDDCCWLPPTGSEESYEVYVSEGSSTAATEHHRARSARAVELVKSPCRWIDIRATEPLGPAPTALLSPLSNVPSLPAAAEPYRGLAEDQHSIHSGFIDAWWHLLQAETEGRLKIIHAFYAAAVELVQHGAPLLPGNHDRAACEQPTEWRQLSTADVDPDVASWRKEIFASQHQLSSLSPNSVASLSSTNEWLHGVDMDRDGRVGSAAVQVDREIVSAMNDPAKEEEPCMSLQQQHRRLPTRTVQLPFQGSLPIPLSSDSIIATDISSSAAHQLRQRSEAKPQEIASPEEEKEIVYDDIPDGSPGTSLHPSAEIAQGHTLKMVAEPSAVVALTSVSVPPITVEPKRRRCGPLISPSPPTSTPLQSHRLGSCPLRVVGQCISNEEVEDGEVEAAGSASSVVGGPLDSRDDSSVVTAALPSRSLVDEGALYAEDSSAAYAPAATKAPTLKDTPSPNHGGGGGGGVVLARLAPVYPVARQLDIEYADLPTDLRGSGGANEGGDSLSVSPPPRVPLLPCPVDEVAASPP